MNTMMKAPLWWKQMADMTVYLCNRLRSKYELTLKYTSPFDKTEMFELSLHALRKENHMNEKKYTWSLLKRDWNQAAEYNLWFTINPVVWYFSFGITSIYWIYRDSEIHF